MTCTYTDTEQDSQKISTQKKVISSHLPNLAPVVLHGVQIVAGSDEFYYTKRNVKLMLECTSEIHTQLEIISPWDFTGGQRPEAKIRNCLYLRAQTELGELLGISKHKTSATMRLQLVLDHGNTILRSRIDIFGKILSKSMNSVPNTNHLRGCLSHSGIS